LSVIGIIEEAEVAEFGHHGDSHGELYVSQELKRVDYLAQAPRLDLFLEFLFETLEAFSVLVDGADTFLKDDVLSRGGTDDFWEPLEVGKAPGGPARRMDIMPEQEGVEPELGALEIADSNFKSATEIPNGFIFDPGDIDWCEITRAYQAG
jgi:hypothetical protein